MDVLSEPHQSQSLRFQGVSLLHAQHFSFVVEIPCGQAVDVRLQEIVSIFPALFRAFVHTAIVRRSESRIRGFVLDIPDDLFKELPFTLLQAY